MAGLPSVFILKPVGIRSSKKGYQTIHRCARCSETRIDRVAENTEQPDDIDAIIELVHRKNAV